MPRSAAAHYPLSTMTRFTLILLRIRCEWEQLQLLSSTLCIHHSSYFCLSGFIRSIFIITSGDLWPPSNWSNGSYTVYLVLCFGIFPLPLLLPSFPLTPSYLLLLSNPLSLCLALIVYHYVSYAGNRITATGSYFGRSHCLSVNGGDMHNYISERERCARVQKALSSAALRQEFVSRVCEWIQER